VRCKESIEKPDSRNDQEPYWRWKNRSRRILRPRHALVLRKLRRGGHEGNDSKGESFYWGASEASNAGSGLMVEQADRFGVDEVSSV